MCVMRMGVTDIDQCGATSEHAAPRPSRYRLLLRHLPTLGMLMGLTLRASMPSPRHIRAAGSPSRPNLSAIDLDQDAGLTYGRPMTGY